MLLDVFLCLDMNEVEKCELVSRAWLRIVSKKKHFVLNQSRVFSSVYIMRCPPFVNRRNETLVYLEIL